MIQASMRSVPLAEAQYHELMTDLVCDRFDYAEAYLITHGFDVTSNEELIKLSQEKLNLLSNNLSQKLQNYITSIKSIHVDGTASVENLYLVCL